MSACSLEGRDVATGRALRITVEDGVIRSIEEGSSHAQSWIAPGFIDLQVNGYGGFDLNDGQVDPDVVLSLTRRLLARGTTTFLPTLITAPEERIIAALRAIARARQAHPLVARAIPFVHVEGPHISPEDGPRGAHPRDHVRAPNLAEFDRWQGASQNLVGMVTISPHWENAAEYIAALVARGILVSVGHTDARPEQIRAAVDAGATLSTHLGNGVSPFLPRHPNLLWSQLADDRLTATFIADGHHLPPDTLRAMLRAKGIERSVLVSDSVALAGMPPGTYDSPIGGRVELRADGRLCMAGSDFLAGAACSLTDAVARIVKSSICAPHEGFRMATANPGRFVGGRGVLRPGAAADLLSFRFEPDTSAIRFQTILTGGIECLPY
jgi:N-acetylglucosamine-6-phosphate deacetylase